ncbi:MbtH family NRPS accessory protein [Streptomyces sp. NPDC007264]|uniref:MbtH family NRPS accessory protein n=1 Tax=Streptomyces sp. NPDC007264 TaxID=3364777 RepID=UPI0036DD509F
MTRPFDPDDPDDPDDLTHLVLADAAGRRSLWPRWLRVPHGWTVEFGPASYEDCLRRTEVPPTGRNAPASSTP